MDSILESDKWNLGAKAQIDQLRAELEDDYLPALFSLAEDLDKDNDDQYNLPQKLASLFLLEMFVEKIETGGDFRCGAPIEDFKTFLNEESENAQGNGPT